MNERLPCPSCGLPVPFPVGSEPRSDERLCNECETRAERDAAPWWLVTWHESDGNDCTVYGTVVQAADADAAECAVGAAIEAQLTKDGVPFEPDGNALGVYFACSEDCPEDCEGHGGTASREVEGPFQDEASAREARPFYHSAWEMSS
jgi:hypothetical protein